MDLKMRHEEICGWADEGIRSFFGTWKRDKKIDPFLVTWPNTPVLSKEGKAVSGPCVLHLHRTEPKEWTKLILESVQLTNAFAVLLTEQKENEVKVILESPHGSRCWTLPIVRSGDVRRLGKVSVTDNREHLGILWKPKRANA